MGTLECEPVSNPIVDGAAPKYKAVKACYVYHAGVPEWYNPDKTLKTFKLNGHSVTQAQVLSPQTLLHRVTPTPKRKTFSSTRNTKSSSLVQEEEHATRTQECVNVPKAPLVRAVVFPRSFHKTSYCDCVQSTFPV